MYMLVRDLKCIVQSVNCEKIFFVCVWQSERFQMLGDREKKEWFCDTLTMLYLSDGNQITHLKHTISITLSYGYVFFNNNRTSWK